MDYVYLLWGSLVMIGAVVGRLRYSWTNTAALLAALAGALWILAGIEKAATIALTASCVIALWAFYHIPRSLNNRKR